MTPLAQLAASITRLETMAPLVLDGVEAQAVACELAQLRRVHAQLTELVEQGRRLGQTPYCHGAAGSV